MEQVVLLDSHNNEIGHGEKLEVHKQGKLHRAFSIFIFNDKGELLLQKRNKNKYHSGGLWSNTCCSHPRPGEDIEEAAHRRLKEEMGFDCSLAEKFRFSYKIQLGRLFEHEYDHVFVGYHKGKVTINEEEAEDFKWVEVAKVLEDVRRNPQDYSYWFKAALGRVCGGESLKRG
jgi:isopentenyl-diphosphate Delta-isomerase